VRGEFADASLCGELLDYVPHKLFGDFFAPGSSGAAHTAENLPGFNVCSLHPLVQLVVDPVRHGNRSDVTALTAQIHYCPVSLALLQVINGQIGRLVTPQSTGEQEGEQRTITFSL